MYPERERSAKRANTSQHMSAELNTSNTHSNNVRIGYDQTIFTWDRVSERFVMLTLMLQNILIALCMIFATELIITKQFPYTGSFVSDMNRTIPIKEVIQSLLSSSLFIKYINWCMCFFWRLYIIISTCYHLNPYPVFQQGGLSNMVQGLFLIFTDDRGAVPRQKDKV